MYNIWGADLADMQLMSKINKGIRFLFFVLLIFSVNTYGSFLWKIRKVLQFNAFQKILDESNHKANKIWVDKGSEFYNRSMKWFLQNNNVEMYSRHNEGKFVVSERFIRTLKDKIYKYIISISKNGYIDKLDDIVSKQNNTCQKTIKMKPVNENPSVYIDFNKENIKERPKFKVGNHVRMSKFKNNFAIGYVPNLSDEPFIIKKVRSTVLWTCIISDLNREVIVGTLYKKQLQQKNQKEFRIEKVIKRKSDKLYVKRTGYDKSFNS